MRNIYTIVYAIYIYLFIYTEDALFAPSPTFLIRRHTCKLLNKHAYLNVVIRDVKLFSFLTQFKGASGEHSKKVRTMILIDDGV